MLPPPRHPTPHCVLCWYSEYRRKDNHHHANAKRKRRRKHRMNGEDRLRRERLREENLSWR